LINKEIYMYKDKEKQKEATKERVRRYREKKKGVTKDVTKSVTLLIPDVTPIPCQNCVRLESEIASLRERLSAQADKCDIHLAEIGELQGRIAILKKGGSVKKFDKVVKTVSKERCIHGLLYCSQCHKSRS